VVVRADMAQVAEVKCIAAALAAGVLVETIMPMRLDALYKKIKERAPNAQVFILGTRTSSTWSQKLQHCMGG
jgi:hypothetical protein